MTTLETILTVNSLFWVGFIAIFTVLGVFAGRV